MFAEPVTLVLLQDNVIQPRTQRGVHDDAFKIEARRAHLDQVGKITTRGRERHGDGLARRRLLPRLVYSGPQVFCECTTPLPGLCGGNLQRN